MKKFVCGLLSAAIAASGALALTGCASRDEVLKIYNWGDYIEEELIGEFESWYKEETGKKIKVEYSTFDTNEDMITKIEVQHSDYDLVCPSDYMAERMISGGLAQKVDTEIYSNSAENYYSGLSEMVRPFDANNEYFVPYIWGTFGIMYDTDVANGGFAPGSEDMKHWSVLWGKDAQGQDKAEYKGKILVKDSPRDQYSAAMLYSNAEQLKAASADFTDYTTTEYRSALDNIFSVISDDSIARAKSALIEQKSAILDWEVDDGKNDMLAGTTQARIGFFWSCDSGLIMLEDNGKHFYYDVPKEGSNVWVDGWIIPKYAKNTYAANYFLKFINTHEFAKKNFDYLGTSIAQKSVMAEAKAELQEDEEFFANTYDGFKEMYIDMMFPSEETLERCGVMRDFKDYNTKLDKMWMDVKSL